MSSDSSCKVRCLHPDAVKCAVASLAAQPEVARSAALFSALGDPTRLRLLLAITTGSLCTCDLAVVLGVTESAVSHQLRTLKALGLVESERKSQMMFHRLADPVVEILTGVAGRWGHAQAGASEAA